MGPLWIAHRWSPAPARWPWRASTAACAGISQTARLAVFFLALLTPAVAMYPSLLAHATESKERLIATTFGPQAASLREDLQQRLQQAVDQIDAIPSLDELVRLDVSTPAADPARAFAVWSRTDLATYRLTSAVELYSADGRLVSAFRLSLPEYATDRVPRRRAAAGSEPFDEVSPFGSSERHVLRIAPRRLRPRPHGRQHRRPRDARLPDAAVHLVAEPVPRIAAARTGRSAPEGVSGRDVEFIVYGWSRAPIFESGTRRLDAARRGLPAAGRVARAVLGHARPRRADASASTS